MPSYTYVCQDCGNPFEINATLSEYAKGIAPKCPECGSGKVIRAFTPVGVLTSSRAAGGKMPMSCGPGAGPGCCG